jgi:acyl-CoA synthetase (AMP-forming)/AMP-acid ligase II
MAYMLRKYNWFNRGGFFESHFLKSKSAIHERIKNKEKKMYHDPKIKNLGDLIVRNARKYPGDIGVVYEDKRFTWEAFNQRVNRLAHAMLSKGIRKGTAVAGLTRNRNELLETVLAANKIGAIYVPLNIRLATDEIHYILGDVEAKALVFDPAFTETIDQLLAKADGLCQVWCMEGGENRFENLESLMAAHSDEEPPVEVSLDDLAVIAYTSGTTGFPKGAMLTHRSFLDSIKDIPFSFGLCFRSIGLNPSPIYGAGAIASVYNWIYGACRNVLIHFDPQKVLETIEKERVEIMPGAVFMLVWLLDVPNVERYDLSSVKRLSFGGMPLKVSDVIKLKTLFPCADYQAHYGMTESGGLMGTFLGPEDIVAEGCSEKLARVCSAGRANKIAKIRIVREDGDDVEPGGEIGEILIKNPGNMKGYWKRPEATADTLKDGWLYTGDLGWIDEEGYVFVVDRRTDMIKTGGSNVYPLEVEHVLMAHPAIAESAVIGVRDPKWIEAVAAVVRLKPGMSLTTEELKTFCKNKIAGYKIPKHIIMSNEALPRNALGKVLRKDLRKKYGKDA